MKRVLCVLALACIGVFCQSPQQATVYQTVCNNTLGCNVVPLRNIGQVYHTFSVTWRDNAPAVCNNYIGNVVATDVRPFLIGGTTGALVEIPLDFVASTVGWVATNRVTQVFRGSGGFPTLGFQLALVGVGAVWNNDCRVTVNYVGSMAAVTTPDPLGTVVPLSVVYPVGGPFIHHAAINQTRWSVHGFSVSCDIASQVRFESQDTRPLGANTPLGIHNVAAGASVTLPLTPYAQMRAINTDWDQLQITVVSLGLPQCAVTTWFRRE